MCDAGQLLRSGTGIRRVSDFNIDPNAKCKDFGGTYISSSVKAEKIKIAATTFLDPWDLTTHMAGHFHL